MNLTSSEAVRALKNGARALSEGSKFMRAELGVWSVGLARGGADWWLSVEVKPGTEPGPQDWYSLGWLVGALGAPSDSREPGFSLAVPFTWEWRAEDQCACSEFGPGHLPGCPMGGPAVSEELIAKIARGRVRERAEPSGGTKAGDVVEIGTSDGLRRLLIVEGPTVTYRVTVQRLDGSPDETGMDGGPVVEVWSDARIEHAKAVGKGLG